MPTRVLFATYLSILTLFAFWRAVLLLFFRIDLSLSHWALYLQSFLVGIRLDLMNKDHNLPQLYGISALKGGDGFACRVSHKNLQWITPNHTYYEFMGSDKHQLFTYHSIWDDVYTELPTSDPRFNILLSFY